MEHIQNNVKNINTQLEIKDNIFPERNVIFATGCNRSLWNKSWISHYHRKA